MWTQMINIGIGIWLMAAPYLLGYPEVASDNGHITGPLIVTFSTLACWEVLYSTRMWNLVPGIWLVLAPWVLGYDFFPAICSDMISGILVLIFAGIKTRRTKVFNGGWSMLWS